MRYLSAVLVLVPGLVAAAPTDAPVIGGTTAPAGQWPDVAAVNLGGQQACTGTLIAPTVVITAGHCNDPTLDSVVVGTSSLATSNGETIAVARRIEYPASQSSIDVTVLVLASASTKPPRAIATGWARADIVNGAAVEFVGFGAIDRDGNTFVDDLQQAKSTITDFDCTKMPGCNVPARPDGELGAGGMNIDTCPGDSGGPMYLLTDYGTFLAGVTSRSYDNALYACGAGGIYGRPDKIVAWIEEQTGVPVTRGPEPTAAPIMAVRGNAGDTAITANDPKSTDHTFAVTAPPATGTAAVDDHGHVRVCTDPSAAGASSVGVTVTDAKNGARSAAMTIPITTLDGSPGSGCDVNDFGGGCCDAGHGRGGAVPLALGVFALLRRRRGY